MLRRFLLVSAFLAAVPPLLRAEDYKFTALFVMNFAKYVDWPAEVASGDFVITVVGNDPIIDELKTIAEKTTIGAQKLVIRKAESVDQIEPSRIVYISPGKSAQLSNALAKFASGVLVVTNGKGLAEQGAAINLVEIDGKQRYEINTDGFKKSGLGAKPVLFKLGKVLGS